MSECLNVPSLPLICHPYLDETFGSWLHRCADAYCTTTGRFADSVLAMAGEAPITATVDWDAAPPPQLLRALTKVSPFTPSELEYLVVPATPATLPPQYRDTYCPTCFVEDSNRGPPYFRRAWLDAWTIHCPTHGCLLGRYSAYEYLGSHRETTRFPGGLRAASSSARRAAKRPSVRAVQLPPLHGGEDDHWARYFDQPWFDARMLKEHIGRDLFALVGSEEANCLFSELFGFPRPIPYTWHRDDRDALWWPGISHPIASIDARVNVAYLASLLWHCFEGSECARKYFDFVKAQMRKTLMHPDCRRTNTEIFNRWSRDERFRWNQIFS